MTPRVLLAKLRSLAQGRRDISDLDEEINTHLAMEIEEAESSGTDVASARKRFGNRTAISELAYDRWTFGGAESVALDLRFAWRSLIKSPGFTIIAALTLALGIGANTAILTIADAVLFRPLPYDDPDRVFTLVMIDKKSGRRYGLVPSDYLNALDEHHRGLSEAGVLERTSAILDTGEPENVTAVAVDANYFRILGIQPTIGRLLAPGDDRAILLSHETWKQRYGGDTGIVGRSVPLGKMAYSVAGVLPKDFVFPSWRAGRPEFVTLMERVNRREREGAVNPVVRLVPGVTREQAQAELDAIAGPVAEQEPSTSAIQPVLADIRTELYPVGRSVTRYLLAAAVLVLLIGCANLANMLTARAKHREREHGVRAALGASRARVVRPVIFESLILGLTAAGLAVLLNWASFDMLLRHVPTAAYGNAPVGVSHRVVVFTIALGFAAGLLFAAAPALLAARLDALALIRGRRERGRGFALRNMMVGVQVALSMLLVFGSAIAVREFLAVLRTPLGFDPQNVVTVAVTPPPGLDGLARREFYSRITTALARRADIAAVGAAGALPLSGYVPEEPVKVNGSRDGFGATHIQPGYFEAAGIRLKRGRLPAGPNEAAMSESFVRGGVLGSRDPLDSVLQDLKDRQYRVTGIVEDVRERPVDGLSQAVYIVSGESTRVLTILVRTRAPSASLLTDIKREVGALAPGRPVTVRWWPDTIGALTEYRNPRFQSLVLGSFSSLALILTALGTYGVVAFMVARHKHELGVRLAIGASPANLIRFATRRALTPIGAGLAAGLAASIWFSHVRQVVDVATLVLAAVTVAGVALLAAYLPARKAGRLDPVIVLRQE